MKATCQTIFLSHHHLHRSCDMSFRQTFSRFRKKAKDKLSNTGNSAKGRGTSVSGEGLGHSSLSLQSEPAIVVESELRADTGIGVGNDDSLSVSPPVAGLEREPGGSDDYTTRREHDEKDIHPHAYDRADRGSSQESGGVDRERTGQVDPPQSESDIERPPTPSILQDGESKST